MEQINRVSNELEKLFQSYSPSLLGWVYLIPRVMFSYILISIWNHQFSLHLPIKFRFNQSILSSLVLKDIYSIRTLRDYFIAGGIQRVWDDLYDKEKLSDKELAEVRNAIIYGIKSNIKVANELRNAYLQLIGEISNSVEPLRRQLYLTFVDELNFLVDGYEVEARLKKQRTGYNIEDESKYILAASNSIALKYICTAIAFSLIRTQKDYLDFRSIDEIANLCSETVRIANDLSGYEEDLKEGKASSISIYMQVHNTPSVRAKGYYMGKIYQNLKTSKQYLDNNSDNIFANILVRTTFLATERYLNRGI